jgi:hypothetical protein
MFVGAWIIIIGSIIIASGLTLAQFVVGRFILGVGIQVMVVSAPAYAVEIAPPHWRGRAVGEYTGELEHSSMCDRISSDLRNRFLQLWLVWRLHSRSCDHIRDQLYRQQLPVAYSIYLPMLCLCDRNYLRLVHPRIA